MTNLPESWTRVEIAEVLEPNNNGKPFQQGWSPQCENYPAPDGQWGVLKTTAIQHGEFWDHENKFLPDQLHPRPQIEVKIGDVLMTCAGPRSRCGVACLVERTRLRLMMSGKMYRFRPHPEAMHPKYLVYFIRTRETQLEIDKMKTGISDSGLNLTHDRFARLKIAVAPINEQHRIVATIEELFSELDKGEECLALARAQLRTYRQALLKHAFEGKLTADWRAANDDILEPPEALLSRIRQERETHHARAMEDWKNALAKWQKNGEVGRKPPKPGAPWPQGNMKIVAKLSLPSLPKGWAWVYLGELFRTAPKNGIYKSATEYGRGTQIVRIDDFYDGQLVRTKGFKKIALSLEEIEDFSLKDGDILVNRVNSVEYLGKCALVRGLTEPTVFESNIMRLTPLSDCISATWITTYLAGEEGRKRLTRNAKNAVNQASINQTDVGLAPIPVCSSKEQTEIRRLLDAQLSQIAQMEAEISAALAKSNILRQSILKKAFSGQLVPQDSSDESAAEQLVCISAAAVPAKRKKSA